MLTFSDTDNPLEPQHTAASFRAACTPFVAFFVNLTLTLFLTLALTPA